MLQRDKITSRHRHTPAIIAPSWCDRHDLLESIAILW